jgi:threonine/homoserine/homoserine lactone efflux protein
MPTPEFLLTSLIVVLIPGTGVIYTVSIGLFQGWRAAMAAAFGCTLGIIPPMLASLCGLAALLHTSALAFQLLKYAGAAYLLYLAWGMWRETGLLSFSNGAGAAGAGRIVLRGILINILNPKLSLFFFAFLPQFIAPAAGRPLPQLLMLSGLFMLMTLVVFCLYGLFAHRVRRTLLGSENLQRRLQRSFAALFAILGLKLALAER